MRVAIADPDTRREAWESLCDPSKGCHTSCCHYEGSPCEQLEWVDEEQQVGRCRIYATRFGVRMTVDGKQFQCASMAAALMHKPAPSHCGYAVITSIKGIPVVRGLP